MTQRSRSLRLVQSIARWTLLFGIVGTVLAGTGLLRSLRSPAYASQRGILVLAAILLSVAFMLAPFVRRALGPSRPRRTHSEHRTLLDEMREATPSETASDSASASADLSSVDAMPPSGAAMTRIAVILYIVFGVALLFVLWALHRE